MRGACEAVLAMLDKPENAIGHAFNVGNPQNNIQIKELAKLMIDLYSQLTGKPNGTTRDVDGVDYYGKGYEDSDLRIPSMRNVKGLLGWEPKTSLRNAMEATMKVFIENYADKLAAKRQAADATCTAPAGKKAKK